MGLEFRVSEFAVHLDDLSLTLGVPWITASKIACWRLTCLI